MSNLTTTQIEALVAIRTLTTGYNGVWTGKWVGCDAVANLTTTNRPASALAALERNGYLAVKQVLGATTMYRTLYHLSGKGIVASGEIVRARAAVKAEQN